MPRTPARGGRGGGGAVPSSGAKRKQRDAAGGSSDDAAPGAPPAAARGSGHLAGPSPAKRARHETEAEARAATARAARYAEEQRQKRAEKAATGGSADAAPVAVFKLDRLASAPKEPKGRRSVGGSGAGAAAPEAAVGQVALFSAGKVRGSAKAKTPPRAPTAAKTPPRSSAAAQKFPFQSPGPGSGERKPAAAGSPVVARPPRRLSSGAAAAKKPAAVAPKAENDKAYETGDSDEDVRAARLTARKKAPAPPASAEPEAAAERPTRALPGALALLKYLVLSMVGVLAVLALVPLAKDLLAAAGAAPCFQSTVDDDTYSDRCAAAAAAHRLAPCPPAGWCQGGDLVACILEEAEDSPFVVAPDGKSCTLAPEANATLRAIEAQVTALTVAKLCGERVPVPAWTETAAATNSLFSFGAPPAVMFDYFQLHRITVAADGEEAEEQEVEWAETLGWLVYAIDHKIVASLALEKESDDSFWIGLAPKETSNLVLPAKCVAQQTIVSTLGLAKTAAWNVFVKLILVRGIHMIWFVVEVVVGASLQAPWLMVGTVVLMFVIKLLFFDSRRLRKETERLIDDCARSEALVHRYLSGHADQYHEALAIRDQVRTELFSGSAADQHRFLQRVWPTVLRKIASDERIRKRDKDEGDQIIEVWKWKMPRSD